MTKITAGDEGSAPAAAPEGGLQGLNGAVPYPFWMDKTRDAHNIALGNAIRQLRKERRLTQQELADRAEVPIEKLRSVEAGSIDAEWGTLRHLAYALEVGLPDVFRLTEKLEED